MYLPPENLTFWQTATFQVTVTNVGAGHYIPTGVSEIREMWIEIMVKDTFNNIIFQSGQVDEELNVDPQARMFRISLADAEGNATHNIAMAYSVLSDHRVPPKGSVTEKYSFFVPLIGILGYTIEAKLRYRSASQSLVDDLLGEDTIILPIIDMASASTSVSY